jgi:hypothetical protein
MRSWIRNPLTWMVCAEVLIVAVLVFVAWRMIGAAQPVLASPVLQFPGAARAASPSPLPEEPGKKPNQHGPLPGLNIDSLFWALRLRQLNREQEYFEQLEWRIVHTATEALKRYVETVVLPSVTKAEHAGRQVVPG